LVELDKFLPCLFLDLVELDKSRNKHHKRVNQ